MQIFKYNILETNYSKVDLKKESEKLGLDIKDLQIHLNDVSELPVEGSHYFYTTTVLNPSLAIAIKESFYESYFEDMGIVVEDKDGNLDFFDGVLEASAYYGIMDEDIVKVLVGVKNHMIDDLKFTVRGDKTWPNL